MTNVQCQSINIHILHTSHTLSVLPNWRRTYPTHIMIQSQSLAEGRRTLLVRSASSN